MMAGAINIDYIDGPLRLDKTKGRGQKMTKHETIREEMKAKKANRPITEMATSSIVWHLVKKHRCFLLVLSNMLTLTLWIMKI